jgi:hypothetical protein
MTLAQDVQSIPTKVVADLTWIKAHLLSVALVAMLTFGSVYGIESVISRHDDVAAKRQDAIAAQMEKSNAQVQASTQQQLQSLATANAALQAQVSSLSSAISKRDGGLAVQQRTDAGLQPSALTQRWSTLLGVSGEVTASTDGQSIVAELPAAIKTVQQLESIPVLTADKADLQTQVSKQSQIIANDAQSLTDSAKALSSEVATHKADNDAAAKDLKSCRTDARKGKLKWFGIGYVAGFLTRAFTVK